jgi:hypothetical protein
MLMTKDFKVTTPAPREIWEKLAENDPQSMIYATPKWMDCINGVEGTKDASRYYEFSNGKQVVLPLVEQRKGWRAASSLASNPTGWGQGGLIGCSNLEEDELKAILQDLRSLGYMQTSIRPSPLAAGFGTNAASECDSILKHSTHILDIREGFEHYWKKKLDSATRNKILRSEKSGLTIECDTTGQAVDDFYRVYLLWTEDRARARKYPVFLYRQLAYMREPISKFRLVSQKFGTNCQIWTAKLDGKPVASAFFLIHQLHAYYWRSQSIKSVAGPTRANEALQKAMIQEACRQGCHYYHMGESGGVPSLIQFKEKFGAEPYYYQEYFLENIPVTKIRQSIFGFIKLVERKYSALGKAESRI